MRENKRRMRKNEEVFLSCPPVVVRPAAPLAVGQEAFVIYLFLTILDVEFILILVGFEIVTHELFRVNEGKSVMFTITVLIYCSCKYINFFHKRV